MNACVRVARFCSSPALIEQEMMECGGVIRIGIIGAGPAGFYTANSLVKDFNFLLSKFTRDDHLALSIDIMDRTPIGNGLVRSGVAPDHPEVKHVQNRFQSMLSDPLGNHKIRFFGNINVGRDNEPLTYKKEDATIAVPLPALQNCYHALVFACGSEGERRLEIPGAKLNGIFSAGAFVRFYNAGLHPAYSKDSEIEKISLQCKKVAIIGQGNVALDAARLILKGPESLSTTDITDRMIQELSRSEVEEVHLFGRRGPIQASFTNKELRELFEIEDCDVYIATEDVNELNEASSVELSNSRTHKRMIAMMKKKAILIPKKEMVDPKEEWAMKKKRCFIHFYMSPVEYLPTSSDDNNVNRIIFEKTELSGEANAQRAKGTGVKSQYDGFGLVLESIGYHPLPIHGIPFDRNGKVIHNEGRIMNQKEEKLEGLYASGWFKRGPSGIIGTNVWDAQETSRSLISDLENGNIPLSNKQPFYLGIEDLLKENQISSAISSWNDWLAIESLEEEKGREKNPPKSREKFTTAQEMRNAANKKKE